MGKQFTKKLKIVLQSKYLYYFFLIFIISYVIIVTRIIKYDTKITNFNYLEGIVTDVKVKNDKITFIIKDKEKIICNYYGNDISNLLGKKVKVYGEKGNLYNNTIPNTFNYKKYLYNNKIYVSYNVNKIEVIEKENVFYKIKNKINKKINSYDEDIIPYLNIFILGDKANLNDELYNIYRLNGIWHLFAISGMHIGLITIVLNKILRKFKYKKVIISLFLGYFAFLTGFSASVLRAIIFYILKNINDYFNLKLNNINILILTMFIILLVNPFMIYNLGFIYSFVISSTLILASKNLTGNYFLKILKISIISFLVSLPITINNNYEINLFSILLNIIYVPFITFIFFPIIISVFMFSKLSFLIKTLIIFLEKSNSFFEMLKIIIIIPKMNLILIICYYLSIIVYFKYRIKKVLCLLIIIIMINKLVYKLDNSYYVYFFDVSQGDSSIIISPHKEKVILIDTGGIYSSSYHVSDNVILFLKSIGIKKINYLILSHGDYDHMGESFNIIDTYKVDNIIFNCGLFNELESSLIEKLKLEKINYYSCIQKLDMEDYKLEFLYTGNYDNENDNSSIIYTEFNNIKFLFMGDASSVVEEELLNIYNINNIDILKVGHHGSKTSSDKNFILNINPKYAIISVGKNNRYGHPNKETLNNLKVTKIYRTDINGSIEFKINKNNLKIKEYIP